MKLFNKHFDLQRPDNRFRMVFYRQIKDNKIKDKFKLAELLEKWSFMDNVLLHDAIHDYTHWEEVDFSFSLVVYRDNYISKKDILLLGKTTVSYLEQYIASMDRSKAMYLCNVAGPLLGYSITEQAADDELAAICLRIIELLAIGQAQVASSALSSLSETVVDSLVAYVVDTCRLSPQRLIKILDNEYVFIDLINALIKTQNGKQDMLNYLLTIKNEDPDRFVDIYSYIHVESLPPEELQQLMLTTAPWVANYCAERGNLSDDTSREYKTFFVMDRFISSCIRARVFFDQGDRIIAALNECPSVIFLRMLVNHAIREHRMTFFRQLLSSVDFSLFPATVLEDIALMLSNHIFSRSPRQAVEILSVIADSNIPVTGQYFFRSYPSYDSVVTLLLLVLVLGGKEEFKVALRQAASYLDTKQGPTFVYISEDLITLFITIIANYYIALYEQGKISLADICCTMTEVRDLLKETFVAADVSRAVMNARRRLTRQLDSCPNVNHVALLEELIAALKQRKSSKKQV